LIHTIPIFLETRKCLKGIVFCFKRADYLIQKCSLQLVNLSKGRYLNQCCFSNRKRGIELPSYEVKILKEQYSAKKRCESLDAYLKIYDFFTGVFA